MHSGKISESDARTLEEICSLIDARTEWYGGALLQATLVRKNQSEWDYIPIKPVFQVAFDYQ